MRIRRPILIVIIILILLAAAIAALYLAGQPTRIHLFGGSTPLGIR